VSEVESTPAPAARTGFSGLPRWLRIGLITAATAVVVLVIAVVIRIILQTPVIPTGVTAAERLLPGSCLLEPGGTSDEYTVVPCSSAHQQQVIAAVDLEFPGVPYTADESLAIYALETCKRLLEYKLYLPHDLDKAEYVMEAVAAPTLAQYDSGTTTTLCAVLDNPDSPEAGGRSEDLTGDLYRPIPQ
jgi:hypothetical protein